MRFEIKVTLSCEAPSQGLMLDAISNHTLFDLMERHSGEVQDIEIVNAIGGRTQCFLEYLEKVADYNADSIDKADIQKYLCVESETDTADTETVIFMVTVATLEEAHEYFNGSSTEARDRYVVDLDTGAVHQVITHYTISQHSK
jgi:hypothetical protein